MKNKILIAVVVVLLTFSAVPVLAANSLTAAPVYKVTVDKGSVNKGGSKGIKVDGGKISVSEGVVEAGKTVTFKATPDKNRKFKKWVIQGSYTIVDGSLTSKTITILPSGDIDVNATFKKVLPAQDEEPTTKEKVPGDDSPTSPQTGAAAGALALALLASGGIAVTSRKKFSK